jgi:hypothetical protein
VLRKLGFQNTGNTASTTATAAAQLLPAQCMSRDWTAVVQSQAP